MTIEQISILIGLVVVAVSVVLYLRTQVGKAGPEVGNVPRMFRPLTNAWFGLMNWPIPYDRSGQLIPVAERTRSKG